MIKIKKLSNTIVDWDKIINDFNKVKEALFGSCGRREMYLWNWVYTAAEITSIHKLGENIDPAREDLANTAKTLGVMWDVLVDDIADDFEVSRSNNLLGYALNRKKNMRGLNAVEKEYLEFCHYILLLVYELVVQLPGFQRHKKNLFKEYKHIKENFAYSLQLRNDIKKLRLSRFVNVLSNNMHMMVNGVMDLMKSDYPEDFDDNPLLRKIFFYGQRMGRIGNSVTTFEYEVPRGDFSSEVVAFALVYRLIDREDLRNREKVVTTLLKLDIEDMMWQLWRRYKAKLEMLADETDLDIKQYLEGLGKLRQLHLQSRGKK